MNWFQKLANKAGDDITYTMSPTGKPSPYFPELKSKINSVDSNGTVNIIDYSFRKLKLHPSQILSNKTNISQPQQDITQTQPQQDITQPQELTKKKIQPKIVKRPYFTKEELNKREKERQERLYNIRNRPRINY